MDDCPAVPPDTRLTSAEGAAAVGRGDMDQVSPAHLLIAAGRAAIIAERHNLESQLRAIITRPPTINKIPRSCRRLSRSPNITSPATSGMTG